MKINRVYSPIAWARTTMVVFAILFSVVFITSTTYISLNPAAAMGNDGKLFIPSLALIAGTEKVPLINNRLDPPDLVVGSYAPNKNKTFLFAHSTKTFKSLKNINLEDEIYYKNETYIVTQIATVPLEQVSMRAVFKDTGEKSLVLMTCAGNQISENDFDARLIVTAVLK